MFDPKLATLLIRLYDRLWQALLYNKYKKQQNKFKEVSRDGRAIKYTNKSSRDNSR